MRVREKRRDKKAKKERKAQEIETILEGKAPENAVGSENRANLNAHKCPPLSRRDSSGSSALERLNQRIRCRKNSEDNLSERRESTEGLKRPATPSGISQMQVAGYTPEKQTQGRLASKRSHLTFQRLHTRKDVKPMQKSKNKQNSRASEREQTNGGCDFTKSGVCKASAFR